MLNKSFDVIIEEDKKTKQFYGSVPNLPGCYSVGNNIEELIKNMKEAISLYLSTQKHKKTLLTSKVLGMVKVTV